MASHYSRRPFSENNTQSPEQPNPAEDGAIFRKPRDWLDHVPAPPRVSSVDPIVNTWWTFSPCRRRINQMLDTARGSSGRRSLRHSSAVLSAGRCRSQQVSIGRPNAASLCGLILPAEPLHLTPMISIKIGNRQVPQLGQGTWNMGDSAGKRADEIAALRCGVELGLQVIDTAEMYGDGRSETLVGEAIRGLREQVYLVTKVLPSHASSEGTVKACEASLKRLGVDALDLYLLHWRGRFALAETVEGFARLQEQGKIKAWGVSNFDVPDMQELFRLPGGSKCAANQVLYNPEARGIEFDLLPWCEVKGVAVMAYSPVGQGGDLLKSGVLKTIARAHGVSTAQVALAWCMRKPLLAIPKAGSVGHVEENAQATDLKLSSEDLTAIDKAFPPPRKKQPLGML